jgi:DNA mismatch repair protein MutS
MTVVQSLSLFTLPENVAVAEATPLMAQYLALKAEYQDYLLFFRLGDFYELFFDDAVRAAAALDIALTKRGKHQGNDIPMCGVPWHQVDAYLARLLRQGFRIAMAEQVESATDGKNKLLERKVVRVVTPGTVVEDNLLNPKAHNFILAIAPDDGGPALAWADITTGAFYMQRLRPGDLGGFLARIEPGEIILPEHWQQIPDWPAALTPYLAKITTQPAARFAAVAGEKRLLALYRVQNLDGFGTIDAPLCAAAGALLAYAQLTQSQAMPGWQYPQIWRSSEFLQIDAASARNLELRRKLDGESKGSLLWAIDRTLTAAGGRLLDQWLLQPLTDLAALTARQDAVENFLAHGARREAVRAGLRCQPDIERALSRLLLDRGGPRDLAALAVGLRISLELRALLEQAADAGELLRSIQRDLGDHGRILQTLQNALLDDLPFYTRDGGFIRPGYSAELDHQLQLRDESARLIAGLQQRYVAQSGVPQLKIKHNNILGYHIEVPPKAAEKIPAGMFTHKQSLTTAVRYVTSELLELEQKIQNAQTRAIALELQIFAELVADLRARQETLRLCARALAQLDVLAGLAELAAMQKYCRPQLSADTRFTISGGRHPVVEQILQQSGQQFIANDCQLEEDGGKLWLLTGPNMAGKSTFLRQNALIAVMAQMGGFVPAAAAEIGLVDKIFSRVGAADDLARGQSTFMVEMAETAAILHQATAQSLVILDEVGRGTATHDGLAIAWAVVEYLHDRARCRGLFATHYHELTALAGQLPGVANYRLQVREWQNEIVFLHHVEPGVAERSYGLHVARLAGLPQSVLARAKILLDEFEIRANAKAPNSAPATPISAPRIVADPLRQALLALDLNELSPRQAHDLLSQWQKDSG